MPLRLVRTQVELRSAGMRVAGVYYHGHGTSTFLATNVTFRQSVCWPIFLRHGFAEEETVLRDVIIEMPTGCDASTLQSVKVDSVDFFVRSRGCSDTFTSADLRQVGVCSANALCVDSNVMAEQLTGLYCTCAHGTYPNPNLAPNAPYEAGGCLVPTLMDKLTFTSTSVQRSLQKPLHSFERMHLTLDLVGTDRAVMMWNISNAAELRTSAMWLRLPMVSAHVPTLPSGQAVNRVEIELELNAVGQRERAEAYAATLFFSIRSYAPHREPQTLVQEREVPVAR